MTPDLPAGKPLSRWSARRAILLGTTILGLGAAAMIAVPNVNYPTAFAQNLSQQTQQTQNIARPVGFADIVEKVKPAVMSVRVKKNAGPQMMSDDGDLPLRPGSPMERFFRQFGFPDNMTPNMPRMPRGRQFTTGQGSGFFISADGYAVTNNHVVDKADSVEVTTDDGKTHSAKVIGTDPRTDLALIKVEGGNFPFVKLAENSVRIGDWVLAVGNPFGLGGTVTAGIVSARGRDIGAGPYDDFIQIDAPVNKGNSGGPTFDVDGNVIGVNTAIFSPSGGSVGIAFAIPAETVKSVITQLKDNGSVSRGWIGVEIQPVTADIADSLGLKRAAGALVASPTPDGPAAKAGIEAGDVIVSINDAPVRDAREVARRIGAQTPGSTIKLGVVQKGAEKTLTFTLGELPKRVETRAGQQQPDNSGTAVPRLGLALAPAGEVAGSGSEGVVVTSVDPNGMGAEVGLKTGDVILNVGGKAVASAADVRKAFDDARTGGKRTVLVRIKSGESARFVALPVGRG